MNRPIARKVLECGGWWGTGLTPLLTRSRCSMLNVECFPLPQSGVCPHPSPTAVQDAGARDHALLRASVPSNFAKVESDAGGFTLIEITLSLAVIAFALIAIIGVLPIGLRVQRDNREETVINQDVTYLMDALRSGARGLEDLTNYVDAITVKRVSAAGTLTTIYESPFFLPLSYTFPAPNAVSPLKLYSGSNIVGLLSTPKYQYQGTVTNYVTAYMRAISGNASEKPPQRNDSIRELSFAYRLTAELIPYILPDPTLRTAQNLQTNLSELRLTFRWPLFANGGFGSGNLTFRTLASGNVQTSGIPTHFFVQPSTFLPAP